MTESINVELEIAVKVNVKVFDWKDATESFDALAERLGRSAVDDLKVTVGLEKKTAELVSADWVIGGQRKK